MAKEKILTVLEEGLDNQLLTKDEFEAMDPREKNPGKFYATFKVHKSHQEGKAPLERPIVSCCNSLTENIGEFCASKLRSISDKHESYLQDTPDFLRQIDAINAEGKLPDNAILAALDVSALYTNIPQDMGLDEVETKIENQTDTPAGFIRRLLEIVLKYNFFEFDSKLYKQEIGTAMGSKPAPDFANIFMSKIDDLMVKMAATISMGTFPLRFFKRFLDDIFTIFCGTAEELHKFHNDINSLHPNIKFTLEHTSQTSEQDTSDTLLPCGCIPKSTLAFLDTSCSIVEGKIVTDLYKKPTDRNMYLLPSSCHPAHTTNSIPYSLALRIIRICSNENDRDKRLEELRTMLLNREYNLSIVNREIFKAKQVSRQEALKKVIKQRRK